MKYFIDTEFLEGFYKPVFGKRRHFIDLISIGVVSEDGREYYAISNEFNPKDANIWVRENVIDKIEVALFQQQPPFAKSHFNFSLKELLKQYGKSNKQIAREIQDFIYKPYKVKWVKETVSEICGFKDFLKRKEPIEFYGYYSDYDWVLFCSLFGRMTDLPKGFPMYCRDLKQMLDEKETSLRNKDGLIQLSTPYEVNGEEVGLTAMFNNLMELADYPEQVNEHNALEDAKWNRRFYEFLQTL